MNNYLPICIKANLINSILVDISNNNYNASLSVEPTYINGSTEINSSNVKNNMWFSNNQSGQAWLISNVSTVSGNITCNLSDQYNYNSYINDGSSINNSLTTGYGYIFSLNDNGLPNLFPINDNDLLGSRWVTNLMNRFSSKNNYIYINQTNHGLNFGDLITINNGLYVKANSNSKNIIGIIFESSVNGNVNLFSFKPFYNFISNDKIGKSLDGSIGTLYYLDISGNITTNNNPYTSYIKINQQGDALILNTTTGSTQTGSTLSGTILTNSTLSGIINASNTTTLSGFILNNSLLNNPTLTSLNFNNNYTSDTGSTINSNVFNTTINLDSVWGNKGYTKLLSIDKNNLTNRILDHESVYIELFGHTGWDLNYNTQDADCFINLKIGGGQNLNNKVSGYIKRYGNSNLLDNVVVEVAKDTNGEVIQATIYLKMGGYTENTIARITIPNNNNKVIQIFNKLIRYNLPDNTTPIPDLNKDPNLFYTTIKYHGDNFQVNRLNWLGNNDVWRKLGSTSLAVNEELYLEIISHSGTNVSNNTDQQGIINMKITGIGGINGNSDTYEMAYPLITLSGQTTSFLRTKSNVIYNINNLGNSFNNNQIPLTNNINNFMVNTLSGCITGVNGNINNIINNNKLSYEISSLFTNPFNAGITTIPTRFSSNFNTSNLNSISDNIKNDISRNTMADLILSNGNLTLSNLYNSYIKNNRVLNFVDLSNNNNYVNFNYCNLMVYATVTGNSSIRDIVIVKNSLTTDTYDIYLYQRAYSSGTIVRSTGNFILSNYIPDYTNIIDNNNNPCGFSLYESGINIFNVCYNLPLVTNYPLYKVKFNNITNNKAWNVYHWEANNIHKVCGDGSWGYSNNRYLKIANTVSRYNIGGLGGTINIKGTLGSLGVNEYNKIDLSICFRAGGNIIPEIIGTLQVSNSLINKPNTNLPNLERADIVLYQEFDTSISIYLRVGEWFTFNLEVSGSTFGINYVDPYNLNSNSFTLYPSGTPFDIFANNNIPIPKPDPLPTNFSSNSILLYLYFKYPIIDNKSIIFGHYNNNAYGSGILYDTFGGLSIVGKPPISSATTNREVRVYDNLILPNGNIGIRYNNPQYPLSFGQNATKQVLAIFQDTSGNDFYGMGALDSKLHFSAGVNKDADSQMKLDKWGNLDLTGSIKITRPGAPIDANRGLATLINNLRSNWTPNTDVLDDGRTLSLISTISGGVSTLSFRNIPDGKIIDAIFDPKTFSLYFQSLGSGANNFSLLTIDGLNNRIGMKINRPNFPLSLGPTAGKQVLAVYDEINNGRQFFHGFGNNNGFLHIHANAFNRIDTTPIEQPPDGAIVISPYSLDSSGNKNGNHVGIGNSFPYARLHVNMNRNIPNNNPDHGIYLINDSPSVNDSDLNNLFNRTQRYLAPICARTTSGNFPFYSLDISNKSGWSMGLNQYTNLYGDGLRLAFVDNWSFVDGCSNGNNLNGEKMYLTNNKIVMLNNLIVNNGKNVGIRNNNPQYMLSFGRNASKKIIALYEENDGSNFHGIGALDNKLHFSAGVGRDGDSQMKLDSSGNLFVTNRVVIGNHTNDPTAMLDIRQKELIGGHIPAIQLSSDVDWGTLMSFRPKLNGKEWWLFATDNISSEGNNCFIIKDFTRNRDCIKVRSEDTCQVTINGNLTVTGTINSSASPSDERIKSNISNVSDNMLDKINQIQVKEFNFKDEKLAFNKDYKSYGIIAQEVKEILPQVSKTSTSIISNLCQFSSQFIIDTINEKSFDAIITMNENHNLNDNDKIKLCSSKEYSDKYFDEEVKCTVLSDTQFKVTLTNQQFKNLDKVFVYGKEVNDSHTIDPNQLLYPLIKAVQELSQQVKSLQDEIKLLKNI